MPWKPEDVDEHMAGLSQSQKEQWCSVANKALKDCMDNGGKEETCAPKAIKMANGTMSEMMGRSLPRPTNLPIKERRSFEPTATQESDELTFTGHAAVFNTLSNDLGGFREIILPGAFTKTLKEADVPLLIQHEGVPLARTKAGTLKLSQDDIGLAVRAELDTKNPAVQMLESAMRRGDIDQMSFAFRVPSGKDKWTEEKGYILRTVSEAQLFDVSVVTGPGYSETDAAIRSALIDELRNYLPSEPGLDAHSDEEQDDDAPAGVSADLLWRELDLKARQY